MSTNSLLRTGYDYFNMRSQQEILAEDRWLRSDTTISEYQQVFRCQKIDGGDKSCLDFLGRGIDPDGRFASVTSVSLSGGHNATNPKQSTEIVGNIFRMKVWQELQNHTNKYGKFDVIFYCPGGGHYCERDGIRNKQDLFRIGGILLVRLRIIEKLYKLLADGGNLFVELPIPLFDISTFPSDDPVQWTEWDILKYVYEGIEQENMCGLEQPNLQIGNGRLTITAGMQYSHLTLREYFLDFARQRMNYLESTLKN